MRQRVEDSLRGPQVRGPHFATLMVLTNICVLHERYKMA
jgi:hypothetical protein